MARRFVDELRRGPLGRIEGTTLGPYLIESELARGGMGAVLRARHGASGATVALKVILTGSDASERERKRFLREASLAQEGNNPGFVPVLDVGQADGLLYIAFELIQGATLEALFEEGLPWPDLVDLLGSVARSLGQAHARGVVHRDLKPANVLVRASDRAPLVADFGLARDLNLSSSLTQEGRLLGTPAYMSPEQAEGKETTPATDVFALGVMLYEGLTGSRPFEAENVALRFGAIMSGPPTRPSKLEPAIPRRLDDVCLRALHPAPADRYPDAGAFADALEGALDEEPPASNALIAVGVVALLGIAGVVAAVAIPQLSEAPRPASAGKTAAPPPRPKTVDPQPPPAKTASPPSEGEARKAERLRRAQEAEDEARPWRQRTPPRSPPRRDGHALVYDAARKHVLLWGGWGRRREVFRGTWAWDGRRWTLLAQPGAGPPGRHTHRMAYDPIREEVVLYGGDGRKRYDDTWTWNGKRWRNHGARQPPGPRTGVTLVYHPGRRRVLMFGGARSTTLNANDLWEWDGRTWREIPVADGPQPQPRARAVAFYDAGRKRLVVLGGRRHWSAGHAIDDMWEWDGKRWHKREQGALRPTRSRLGLISTGREVLAFTGGDEQDRYWSRVYAWTGARWLRRNPSARPVPRNGFAVAWDPVRNVVVTFGGLIKRVDTGRLDKLNDTWEYPTRQVP